MKHTITLTAAIIALAATSNAATIVNISDDAANSSASFFGGSVAATLGDGFAYNPDAPTSVLPDQTYNSNGDGFHADDRSGTGDGVAGTTISYTLDTAFTAAQTTEIYFDFYGRNTSGGNFTARDDNYIVTLYNGDYATVVSSPSAAQSGADTAPFYNRTTFTINSGDTFDRIQLNTGTAFFTVMEVRAASEFEAIPEPSSTALLGLAGLGLILRRRR